MSNNDKWLATLAVLGIVAGTGYFLGHESQVSANTLVEAVTTEPIKALSIAKEEHNIPNSSAIIPIKTLTQQKIVGATSVDKENYLTHAEHHTIEQWRTSLGLSHEQSAIYKSYDKETLLSLAAQGDIYALEESHDIFLMELDYKKANQALMDAAIYGSTRAFLTMGSLASSRINSLRNGHRSEQEVREIHNLKNVDIPIEQALGVLAGAAYIVSAMRGNVMIAGANIKSLQQNILERNFTKEEMRAIVKSAQSLYNNLAAERKKRGLDEFDNSYPEAYARHHGYPKENTVIAESINYLESL